MTTTFREPHQTHLILRKGFFLVTGRDGSIVHAESGFGQVEHIVFRNWGLPLVGDLLFRDPAGGFRLAKEEDEPWTYDCYDCLLTDAGNFATEDMAMDWAMDHERESMRVGA